MTISPGDAGEREAWIMDMMATPVAVARTSILRTTQFRGGIQGRILVRQLLTDIRLEYVRFYMVRLPYSVEARRFPFRRHATEGVMTVIVNALYGRCAVKDTDLQLAPVQGGHFQQGKFELNGQEAVECAEDFARRIVMRMCRNLPTFGEASCETFFRPYWMAYYGQPDGEKPRYLPFEADGLTFKR